MSPERADAIAIVLRMYSARSAACEPLQKMSQVLTFVPSSLSSAEFRRSEMSWRLDQFLKQNHMCLHSMHSVPCLVAEVSTPPTLQIRKHRTIPTTRNHCHETSVVNVRNDFLQQSQLQIAGTTRFLYIYTLNRPAELTHVDHALIFISFRDTVQTN